jgi:hypothetical protein
LSKQEFIDEAKYTASLFKQPQVIAVLALLVLLLILVAVVA